MAFLATFSLSAIVTFIGAMFHNRALGYWKEFSLIFDFKLVLKGDFLARILSAKGHFQTLEICATNCFIYVTHIVIDLKMFQKMPLKICFKYFAIETNNTNET